MLYHSVSMHDLGDALEERLRLQRLTEEQAELARDAFSQNQKLLVAW